MRKIAIVAIVVLAIIFAAYPLNTTGGPRAACDSCHSGFTAFSITIDAPTEVPTGHEFQYKAIVKNTGSHDVLDLKAKIMLDESGMLTLPQENATVQSTTFSGEATVLEDGHHTFKVEEKALQAIITLTGDAGLQNDLDLAVTSPKGSSWESASLGVEEQLVLSAADLEKGGEGDWSISVIRFRGTPSISYQLSVEVSYGGSDAELAGNNLGPGEEFVFVWNLESGQDMGPSQVEVMVTGTAYYEHNNPSTTNEATYSYTEGSDVVVGGSLQYEEPTEIKVNTATLKLLGRVSGMLLLFGLLVSVALVSGLNLGKYSKYRMRIHCFCSFLLVPLTGIHVVVLYLGPYRGLLKGFWSGLIDLAVISVLVYSGYDQARFVNIFGKEKWKKYHYYLALLALIINLTHAVINGTDFAGLR